VSVGCAQDREWCLCLSEPRTVQQHQLAVVQHHDPVQQHGLQAQRQRDAWLYERLAGKAGGQGEAVCSRMTVVSFPRASTAHAVSRAPGIHDAHGRRFVTRELEGLGRGHGAEDPAGGVRNSGALGKASATPHAVALSAPDARGISAPYLAHGRLGVQQLCGEEHLRRRRRCEVPAGQQAWSVREPQSARAVQLNAPLTGTALCVTAATRGGTQAGEATGRLRVRKRTSGGRVTLAALQAHLARLICRTCRRVSPHTRGGAQTR